MSLFVGPHVLMRAPLLPVAALDDPGALQRHPLGPRAVALASPDLSLALATGGVQAFAALGRYNRRAAYRPTPAGLLAGVSLGRLGMRTRIATGAVSAHVTPSWANVCGVARALLDDPLIRARVWLRPAPSLLVHGDNVTWLALTDSGLHVRTAALDEEIAVVAALPDAGEVWPRLAKKLDDERLLTFVDEGLLWPDLFPPLVGPAPQMHLRERLAAMGAVEPLAALDEAGWSALPGASAAFTAMLRHEPRQATISEHAVLRATSVAPVLFGLQEALAGPVAERALDPAVPETLAGIAELFGAGALDTAALALGGYGVTLPETHPAPSAPAANALLAHLVQQLVDAARAGAQEIELDVETLAPLLPAVEPPPTFELFLTPSREPRGAAPGTGWLLGLHAPAGASFGRFAAILGDEALHAIAEAEREACAEERLDVSFAATPDLADLCTHPPVRTRALALVDWPASQALPVRALSLVTDEVGALALRAADGAPVAPSPLHRVRSTTAPPGLARLLAGWTFARQHRPWGFDWGPLAHLPFLPRVRLGGFVVAPASWSVPPLHDRAALGRWRRAHGVPRWVQVGEGDELLPLDLEKGDLREARGRVFEIWPPLEELPDRGGRRVEFVVPVVGTPDEEALERQRAAATRTRHAASISAPTPAPGWATHRIYGPQAEQDGLLQDVISPVIAAARASREIDAFFFVRYVERGRHHLRVRVHGPRLPAFARRLQAALRPARARGAVTTIEQGEYFRETDRYGGATLIAAAERVFEASSDLALAALAGEDRRGQAVRAADTLAEALGLSPAERLDLAARRRAAFAAVNPEAPELRDEIRARRRPLMAWLSGARDEFSPALDQYSAAVAAVARRCPPAALVPALPALLHMQCGRLLGPDPGEEQLVHVLWERTRAALRARGGAG